MSVGAIIQQVFYGVRDVNEARERAKILYDPPCLYRRLRVNRDYTDPLSLIACQDRFKAECGGVFASLDSPEDENYKEQHTHYTLTVTLPPQNLGDEAHSRIGDMFDLKYGRQHTDPKIVVNAEDVYDWLGLKTVSKVDFVARVQFFSNLPKESFIGDYSHPQGFCVEFCWQQSRGYSILTNYCSPEVPKKGVQCFDDDVNIAAVLCLDEHQVQVLHAIPDKF